MNDTLDSVMSLRVLTKRRRERQLLLSAALSVSSLLGGVASRLRGCVGWHACP